MRGWTFNRQPQFRSQPKGQLVGWIYGLFSDKPGNYVKKTMRECTGKEICMEWLFIIWVYRKNEIEDMAEHSANTVPCMMPYITAFFMPRAAGDRPKVVPDGAVNFAFLGTVRRDCQGYHLHDGNTHRTGMEAALYAAKYRPWRTGSLGQCIRYPRPAGCYCKAS